nr:MAG TPA: hypothetical protein [Caudoviricetes sp.]
MYYYHSNAVRLSIFNGLIRFKYSCISLYS